MTSLSGKKFPIKQGDLVTVKINREVTARRRPMRRYSTSFDKENGFVLIYHILAEFRKEFKSKMRLKTASTEKWKVRKSKFNHF